MKFKQAVSALLSNDYAAFGMATTGIYLTFGANGAETALVFGAAAKVCEYLASFSYNYNKKSGTDS